MTISLLTFLLSFALILWAGKILPRELSNISKVFRFSEFFTAFILVSFATSVPELFIGISSALEGVPGISLGNIMGANLVNITLVVGASVLLAGTVRADGHISSQNFWLIFLMSLFPILLATDGVISRGDGILLLAAFALYVHKVFRDREYFHKDAADAEGGTDIRTIGSVMTAFFRFLGGMAVLLLSSFVLITSAQFLVGEFFDVSFILFGVLFVAIGTALPELVFGIRMTRNGQAQAMLGNALGSVAFNAAAVIGIVAVLSPITLDFSKDLLLVSAFLFVGFVLFHLFVYTKNHIVRAEGLILFLIYVLFLTVSLFLA